MYDIHYQAAQLTLTGLRQDAAARRLARRARLARILQRRAIRAAGRSQRATGRLSAVSGLLLVSEAR